MTEQPAGGSASTPTLSGFPAAALLVAQVSAAGAGILVFDHPAVVAAWVAIWFVVYLVTYARLTA